MWLTGARKEFLFTVILFSVASVQALSLYRRYNQPLPNLYLGGFADGASGPGQFGCGCVDDRRFGCPSARMTMDQAKQLSELIGEVYDAALDPSLWSDVVGKAGRFVGGSSAAIYSKSPITGNGNVYYESSTDPYYRQLYFDEYVKIDPTTIAHYFADVEQPVAVADIMPYGEFLETRFYKEWCQPQGMVDANQRSNVRGVSLRTPRYRRR
jgi:hypothetical protein